MSYITRLNKKLNSRYHIKAELDNGRVRLIGELSDWNDVVGAGLMAAKGRKYPVISDIRFTGAEIAPMKIPTILDHSLEGSSPDVLIIGGGVVGCAIARELMRYKLDVLLIEKEHDLAMHASGRNDGMVHPGIDLRLGQIKRKYNTRGNRMYAELCAELGVPFKHINQFLCFASIWMKPITIGSLLYWKFMRLPAKYVGQKELREKEPQLSKDIKCALNFPSSGIVCPYGLTIALAENAVSNGARVFLDTAAVNMETENGKILSVRTNRGVIYPKLVINAAGVFAEDIAKMARDRYFSIHPRRGTNMILDKKAAKEVDGSVSRMGGSSKKKTHSKGGGVMRTVDGNLLVGPDAIETYEKENFATHPESIANVLEKHRRVVPGIGKSDIITYFTGIRAATYEEDFYISFGKSTENIIHAAGIQSPGLTAAPAIAVDVAEWAAKYLRAFVNDKFNPKRDPIIHMAELPHDKRNAWIQKDPDYGVILCRCEEISKGEIRDALRRNIPCDTVDGVKRRVRPGMGRCQGSFCGPLVLQVIAEELGIPIDEVKKGYWDSRILLGNNKE